MIDWTLYAFWFETALQQPIFSLFGLDRQVRKLARPFWWLRVAQVLPQLLIMAATGILQVLVKFLAILLSGDFVNRDLWKKTISFSFIREWVFDIRSDRDMRGLSSSPSSILPEQFWSAGVRQLPFILHLTFWEKTSLEWEWGQYWPRLSLWC